MEECEDWFLGYIMPGPSKDAFDRFWSNEDNLHQEFQDMWVHMIERFRDNERVLGFELMNEPGTGNVDEETFVPPPRVLQYADQCTENPGQPGNPLLRRHGD